MRDYWCSAMVKAKGDLHWGLWMRRIQADNLSAARACAIRLIAENGDEFGRLDILRSNEPACIAADVDYIRAVKEASHESTSIN